MSDTMPQELTLAALAMALLWRDPPAGLMHHSDRGAQYAAGDYRKALAARGITVWMSRKGRCWENKRSEFRARRARAKPGTMRRWSRPSAR